MTATFPGTLKPKPFTVHIPDASLDDLKSLIRLGRLPPATFEGSDRKYGVTNEWMKHAKQYWHDEFNWRKHEKRINTFPNYTVSIKDDDGRDYTIHFVGVLSSRPNAVPLILLHGWPGSFLEFLDIIPILAASTSPAFHIIVPSAPGYAFSSPPPVDLDFTVPDVARLLDKLMVGLGFGGGYVAQGGDIGAIIARVMAVASPSVKAVHHNFGLMPPPVNSESLALTEVEKIGLQRGKAFNTTGNAYAIEHASRPSTIGHVLASNPLALLAWVAEKFLDWTDEDPSLDTILESVTLYWLTETFPRSIYPYRRIGFTPPHVLYTIDPAYFIHKPLGFSYFPQEISPTPRTWVETTGNLVFFRYHDAGGHFAALERPEILAKDIADFVSQVYKAPRQRL